MNVELRCPRCDQPFAPATVDATAVCPHCGLELSSSPTADVHLPPSLPSELDASGLLVDAMASTMGPSPDGYVTIPRFVLYTQGVLLAVVAIAAFVLGAGFGGLYSSHSGSTDKVQVPCDLHGRITRSRADGQEIGVDARVIVLPADRVPDERWTHDGLRPGQDVPPADHQALVGIRVLGGGFVTTNARGDYRLRLPAAGQYYVLVLTEPTGRREVSWNKRDLAQVGRYFRDAMSLLGPCDYRWQLLTVTPDEQWNVGFPSR